MLTPASRKTKAVESISTLAICAVLLSGCGTQSSPAASSQNDGTAPARTSSSPLTPHADAGPTPHVVDARLVDPISFEGGNLVFKPPPGDVKPSTSSDAAVAEFKKSGLYSAELTDETPEPFLASLTSYQSSDSIGSDGHLLPDQKNRLVWVVYFHAVPSMPIGPGRPSDSPAPTTQPPVPEDILGLTDATTGTMESVETTVADAHVRNLDEGPIPDPSGKPTR